MQKLARLGLILNNSSKNAHFRCLQPQISRFYSDKPEPPKVLTARQKLQKAVTEYGSTVIVFHVGISLVSLGTCYLIVSSGLDVEKAIIIPLGISGETSSKLLSSGGTFAVAYAVHKVFAPLRIGATLTCTPFIVRYLRQVGVLKKP